ncbi:MAG: lipid A phosphoethanolamine transferase [Staphylococcus sp.]|nr:lipid A phosphoethanolamine transferase [Staphylococcus sp.]
MFPLVFLAAFQIVLLKLYGRSIIAVDMFLNLVTTNVAEVTELLGNMLPAIILVVVLYVPSLIAASVFISKRIRLTDRFLRINRNIAAATCVAGLLALICAETISCGNYSVKADLYPVNVCYNIYLAYDRTRRTLAYDKTSAGFRYDSYSVHPDNERELYLLVIGETSRAGNWQLMGYDRNTNPKLSKRGDIYHAPKTYSESNTTHKSVPMLLSPVDATTFDEKIYSVKSIITAFKEAGFSTAFLSNQRYNHSFIDFFAFESDTTVFIKENDTLTLDLDINRKPDSDLMPILDEIIAKGKLKQLVVLHTYGSHFNYRDRYMEEDNIFAPCDYHKAAANERQKLINAYDNTIVVTDRFLNSCIERLESIGGLCGLLYTSDHGEDIYDDKAERFLHASPRPTIHQVHVPMIAWLSDEYKTTYPEYSDNVSRNMRRLVSSSRSYAPSALDMAGIKVSGNALPDTTASLFSRDYKPRTPLYLSDHNKAVDLNRIL